MSLFEWGKFQGLKVGRRREVGIKWDKVLISKRVKKQATIILAPELVPPHRENPTKS